MGVRLMMRPSAWRRGVGTGHASRAKRPRLKTAMKPQASSLPNRFLTVFMRHLTLGIKPSREAADACQLSAQKPMRIASGARQRLGRQVTFPMDEKTPFSKQSAETPY